MLIRGLWMQLPEGAKRRTLMMRQPFQINNLLT